MSLLGKFIYKLYYQPRGKRAIIRKFGGKQNYLAILEAESEMRSYALNKLELKSQFAHSGKYKISFLTGEKYIHQTLFCIYSFSKWLTPAEVQDIAIDFYDDGSLTPATLAILRTRFYSINVIDFDKVTSMLQRSLPEASFPHLNKKLKEQPLFKKLIFPHLENTGLSIFFDSDMIFFNRPTEFLDWLYMERDMDHAFSIQDVQRSYGYSDVQIMEVSSIPLKNNINSGMYAIFSERMHLPFIERIAYDFEKKYGSQYYIEQLITAIILERSGELFIAPKSEYIVLPTKEQITNKAGKLQHFVNESKELYFKEAWKLI